MISVSSNAIKYIGQWSINARRYRKIRKEDKKKKRIKVKIIINVKSILGDEINYIEGKKIEFFLV